MPKFAKLTPVGATSTVVTADRILTHEGGYGYERDAKSELFLLAVTNMVGERTFYEDGTKRDERFENLLRQVTAEDSQWMQEFVPWLRNGANMRSASVVAAAQYALAGGPGARHIVNYACQRPDEPGEFLAYWFATVGRKLPAAVKRGLADAVVRLYNERAVLRYDGNDRTWRLGDVIELVHPKPTAAWQDSLFKYLLDRRHHSDGSAHPSLLPRIAQRQMLEETPADQRRAILGNVPVDSWEWLSGWLPGGMDASAWEAAIPHMGYMALLRNLRNFDQAGVSDTTAKGVADKLADADEVTRSGQFPIRFSSAYKEAGLRWAWALEQALRQSLSGVPKLSGKTVIMLDTSGSMSDRLSGRSTRSRVEVAALFAGAIAGRNAGDAITVEYNTTPHRAIAWQPGDDVLRFIDVVSPTGGTYTMQCAKQAYAMFTPARMVIVTDEQAHDAGSDLLPPSLPVYTINVAGYRPGHLPSGSHNRHTFGGLTDAVFSAIGLLEQRRNGQWPWES